MPLNPNATSQARGSAVFRPDGPRLRRSGVNDRPAGKNRPAVRGQDAAGRETARGGPLRREIPAGSIARLRVSQRRRLPVRWSWMAREKLARFPGWLQARTPAPRSRRRQEADSYQPKPKLRNSEREDSFWFLEFLSFGFDGSRRAADVRRRNWLAAIERKAHERDVLHLCNLSSCATIPPWL